jgi:hypothetical protein
VVTTTVERTARPSGREAFAYAGFTVWILTGLVLDGWSHNTDRPETFFTPWHGLLYSGFLASAAWGTMEAARLRRTGLAQELVDRWSRLGVGMFAAGMVGDFTWHQVFGIEVGIDALLSPTHLLLFGGGLLLATTPLRVAAGDPTLQEGYPPAATVAPILVAAGATTVLTGFFTMYLNGFRGGVAAYVTSAFGRSGAAEERVIQGVATVLVTTLVFVIPLLVAVRIVRTRPGALTATVTVAGIALSGLDGFSHPALILAAVAAGIAADAVVALGRPELVGVAVPLALWPAWFAVLRATGTMAWNAELWTGSCVLATLLGGGLTALAHLGAPDGRDAGIGVR